MLDTNPGLTAARQERAIHKWLNSVKATSAYVVSTSASIYYNIPVGKQVVVAQIIVGCETNGDFTSTYPVGCSAVAGGGDATQVMSHFDMYIGQGKAGLIHEVINLLVPVVLKYSDGHRSVSMAIKATDTDTDVSFGWCGWVEDEGTLS